MEEHRHTRRHAIGVERSFSLAVMSFKRLDWTDYTALVVNFSRNGLGIRSAAPIEPGFVLFKDRVGGHAGGILLWSRREQEQYRAGIRFLALDKDAARGLQGLSPSPGHIPHRAPEDIISTLIRSLEKAD